MATEFTDANFAKEVEQFQGVTMIDFWAPWCGPCKVQGPIVQTLATEFASNPNLKIGKVNVDDNPIVGEKYQILSIPTIKFFKAGKVIDELIGLQSKDSLTKRLQVHIGA